MTQPAAQLDENAVMLALSLLMERSLLPDSDRAWAARIMARRFAAGHLDAGTLAQAAQLCHRHRAVATENGIEVPPLPGATAPAEAAPRADGPTVKITVAGSGELLVVGAPMEMNDLIKTLPGHRFDRRAGGWLLTASPAVAAIVANAARGHGAELAMGKRAKALAIEHTGRRKRAALLDPDAPLPDLDWARHVSLRPWDHQLRMAQFQLDSSASLCAVPMGGGKTGATVLALNVAEAKRVLTVCPNTVRGVWGRELAKHSVRPWHVVDGRRVSDKARAGYVDLQVPDRIRELEHALFDCTCGRPHMAAVNYETLVSELWDGWAPREPLDFLVYDEVHKLKSHVYRNKSRLTVSGRAATWVGFATRRTGLSGTPLATDPAEDAFGIGRALDPGIFGTTWTQHDARYRIKNPKIATHVIGYKNLAELASKLALFMYRPKVQLDLPPATSETVEVELDPATMRAYREMETELVADLAEFISPESVQAAAAERDRKAARIWARGAKEAEQLGLTGQAARRHAGDLMRKVMYAGASELDEDDPETELTAANPMVKLLRLQQLTGGVVATDDGVEARVWDTGTDGTKPSPKGEALAGVLDDVGCRTERMTWSALANRGQGAYVEADPEPVVVFCRFASDLAQVREVVERRGLRYGEISGPRKDGLTRDSTMSPDVDVVGVQIQAGGTGIELVRARIVVWWSVGYSLVDFDQAMKRVHRPGQTRPVLNIFLVAKGTADEAVYAALDGRRSTVAQVYRLAGCDEEQVAAAVAATRPVDGENVDGDDAAAPAAPSLRSDAEPGAVATDLPWLDAGAGLTNAPVYKPRKRKRRAGSPTARPAGERRRSAQELHEEAQRLQDALF